jgi:predicted small lipoprotein YifL
MNRTMQIAVLALSILLIACGNKGELYLEVDEAATEELNQLDQSLEEIDDEAAEKARKKALEDAQNPK